MENKFQLTREASAVFANMLKPAEADSHVRTNMHSARVGADAHRISMLRCGYAGRVLSATRPVGTLKVLFPENLVHGRDALLLLNRPLASR